MFIAKHRIKILLTLLIVLFWFRSSICSIFAYSIPGEIISTVKTSQSITLLRIKTHESKIIKEISPGVFHMDSGNFHDQYDIIDSKELNGATEVLAVVNHIDRQIVRLPIISVACFGPPYAIRINSGHETFDILLCYECQKALIYKNDTVMCWKELNGSYNYIESIFNKSGLTSR